MDAPHYALVANLHRYHYMRSSDGRFRNPFDKGMANNVANFMCGTDGEEDDDVERQQLMGDREMGDILAGGTSHNNVGSSSAV